MEDAILDAEPDDDKAAALIEAWKDENVSVCDRCYIHD
jgi:hypothetical protein